MKKKKKKKNILKRRPLGDEGRGGSPEEKKIKWGRKKKKAQMVLGGFHMREEGVRASKRKKKKNKQAMRKKKRTKEDISSRTYLLVKLGRGKKKCYSGGEGEKKEERVGRRVADATKNANSLEKGTTKGPTPREVSHCFPGKEKKGKKEKTHHERENKKQKPIFEN